MSLGHHIFFFLYNISIMTKNSGKIIRIAYTAYTKVNGDTSLNERSDTFCILSELPIWVLIYYCAKLYK